MDWINGMKKAIDYIEDNLLEEITPEDISKECYISSFYFQKGFSMLSGFTVGDYIRQRRLTLAGYELVTTSDKIIDIAVKYGYDSQDSFTKAFTRFEGATPTAVRKSRAMPKTFAPLRITFNVKGGFMVDCRIEKKEAITVIARTKVFTYDNAQQEVAGFWQEHIMSGMQKVVGGMFGINHDEKMDNRKFEYSIADIYNGQEIPEGFEKKTVPELTWAVFPCKGPMPEAMCKLSKQIFSDWMPNNKDYEMSEGYCIEMYDDPRKYKNGASDKDYYSEIWYSVKKK